MEVAFTDVNETGLPEERDNGERFARLNFDVTSIPTDTGQSLSLSNTATLSGSRGDGTNITPVTINNFSNTEVLNIATGVNQSPQALEIKLLNLIEKFTEQSLDGFDILGDGGKFHVNIEGMHS